MLYSCIGIGMAFMVLSARRFFCTHIGFGGWGVEIRDYNTLARVGNHIHLQVVSRMIASPLMRECLALSFGKYAG